MKRSHWERRLRAIEEVVAARTPSQVIYIWVDDRGQTIEIRSESPKAPAEAPSV